MRRYQYVKCRMVSFVLIFVLAFGMLPGNICVVQANEGNVSNLVVNGDFETATDTQYLEYATTSNAAFGETGYYFYSPGGKSVNYEIAADAGRSGHALKITRPEGSTDAGRAMIQQTLAGSDFEVGATYRASIWVKAVGTDGGYVEPKLLKVRKDATETNQEMKFGVTVKSVSDGDAVIASNGEWVEITYDFVAPGNTFNLQLSVNNFKTGAFYFDDISVVKIEDASEPTIIVTPESTELAVGDTEQFTTTIDAAGSTMGTVQWTSDNEEVAMIDQNGLVTAVAAGNTTIHASVIPEGKEAISNSAVITVVAASQPVVTNLVVNGDFETATDTQYLEYAATSNAAFGETGYYFYSPGGKSVNYEIAADAGRSGHALKITRPEGSTDAGRAMVQQTLAGSDFEVGATYRASIWVKAVDTDSGFVEPKLLKLRKDTTETNQEIKFGVTVKNTSSSATEIASNGEWIEVTYDFVAPGNTFNLQLSVNNFKTGAFYFDDISVTKIKEAPAPAITITPAQSTEMIAGDSQQLTATISPAISDTVTYEWRSSNDSVATIDASGLITAVAEGTVSITVSATGASVEITEGSIDITVAAAVVPPTGIELHRTVETVFVGENLQLLPVATNSNATNGGWEFTSSDTNIATVDKNGVVTGVADGRCKITITNKYAETLSMDCNIIVYTNELTDGGFESNALSPRWVIAAKKPTDAITSNYISYQLDNTESFSGKQSLKLSSTGSTSVAVDVCQNRVPVTAGTTYKFIGKIKTENITSTTGVQYKIYCWMADGDNGAPKTRVIDGKVLSTVLGTTDGWQNIEEIVTIPEGGAWLSVQIWYTEGTGTVWLDEIAAIEWQTITNISLDTSSKYLEVNDTYTLTATTLPTEALDHTVKFESSNPEIASVDENGKITAHKAGIATILVTAVNGGLTSECKITVVDEYVDLDAIKIEEELELQVGSRKKLEVIEYKPSNATNKEVLWSSSNEDVATVDEKGYIVALSAGEAVITATGDGGCTDTCTVKVSESTALIAKKIEIDTAFGESVTGDLRESIENTTGQNVAFEVFTLPEKGKLNLNTDGTFSYLPKTYYDIPQDGIYDRFVVIVSAGTESALMQAEVSMNSIANSLLENLTDESTMLITEAELMTIREAIKDETNVKHKIWNSYKPYIDTLLQSEPPKYEDKTSDEISNGLWLRPVADNTAHLLWGYLISGEDAYKEKCIEYAVASASYPHWAEWDYYQEADLGAGHQAFALGLVYNWLYDDLTDEQRTVIEQKLYYTCGQFVKKWGNNGQYLQNHLWVSLAGCCSATVSLYIHADDVAEANGVSVEVVKENCASWIKLVCDKIGLAFDALPQDGTNHEGVGYHTYGLEYLLKTALIMKSNLGVDMITDNSWLENSSEYFVNVVLPKDSIKTGLCYVDYADGTRGSWYGPSHLYRVIAGLYKDETAQWIAETFEDSGADLVGSSYWMGMLFADTSVEAVSPEEKGFNTLYHADDLGIVVSRSNWSGNESMVFARCGLPLGKTAQEVIDHDVLKANLNEGHVDPDLNALTLFSNGEFLLKTDGITFKKTAFNSTLLVNEVGQIGEGLQGLRIADYLDLGFVPEFTVFEETDSYNYFVGDATEAYAPSVGLRKFKRNVIHLKEENVMIVVDDIKTAENENLQLRWFPESKNVTEAYGIYNIYGSKNILKFYPFTDNVETTFTDVDVYKTETQKTSEKTFIQTMSGNSWQNAVAFAWGEMGSAQASVRYLNSTTNVHQFEVNGKIYSLNTETNEVTVESGKLDLAENEWMGDSTLSGIMFNSVSLEEFNPTKTEYTVQKFWKVDNVTILPITSAPNATAIVEWNGSCPGTAIITCTSEDGESTTIYTLHLNNDENLLNIKDVITVDSTSSISEDCMFDGYIQLVGGDKIWASLNLPDVIFDLGDLKDITKIDIAFNNSSIRSTYYDLLTSEDGETWTMLDEDAESPITTSGLKTDWDTVYEGEAVRARYVRINLRSHSVSGKDNPAAVNSIQEVSIYGTLVATEDEDTGVDGGSDDSENTGAGGGSDDSENTGAGQESDDSKNTTGGGSDDNGNNETGRGSIDNGSTGDGDENDENSWNDNDDSSRSVTGMVLPETGDDSFGMMMWALVSMILSGVLLQLGLKVKRHLNKKTCSRC